MATHYEKYGRSYYQRNKQKALDSNRKNKSRWREEWKKFKATLSCTQCGEKHPATLDFHHLNREEKEGGVYSFVNQGRFKKAHQEAAKCIVLCANCHRKHHYEEREKEKGAKAPFSTDSVKNQAAPGEP
jgi:RNase P subunit RPR2